MEKTFSLQYDGQAVTQDDINTLGSVSGHADDHLYAELFRLTPTPDGSTISRGILPYGSALIVPNGASGTVLVNPFRAMIGSRTVAGTNALLNWQDVRAGLSVADGDTALTTQISITAPASGKNRWDAVYATVSVDADSSSVTRKVKDPSSGVVSSETVVVTQVTSVTVSVQRGVEADYPVWPAIPSDAGSNYNILLGYVCVPDGFGGSSTVAKGDIYASAPCLGLAATTGAMSFAPAAGVTVLSSTVQGNQAQAGGGRASNYLPSTMVGGASLFCHIGLITGSHTHADGDVVDSTRDWRNRFVRYSSATATSGTGSYPDVTALSSGSTFVPNVVSGNTVVSGMGHSFQANSSGSKAVVAWNTVSLSPYLYVDMSTGNLKVYVPGDPNKIFFFWVDFTAPFAAY